MMESCTHDYSQVNDKTQVEGKNEMCTCRGFRCVPTGIRRFFLFKEVHAFFQVSGSTWIWSGSILYMCNSFADHVHMEFGHICEHWKSVAFCKEVHAFV